MPPAIRFGRYRDIAADIADRVCARRGGDALGLWDEDIVVATSGVASAIAGAILQRQGQGVAGLRIEIIDALATRIVNAAGDYPRVASDSERRLAMRTAVRSISHPVLESRGVASLLERSYRDIRDSGLTLDEIALSAQRAHGLRDATRVRLLIDVWREYERLISLLNAIDPADLIGRAAKFAARGIDIKPQIFAGFYDMTGMQRRLLDALRGAGQLGGIWIPAGDGELYRYANPLVAHVASWPDSADTAAKRISIKAPAIAIRELETKEDEVRVLCSEIAALLDTGVDAAAIGIVTRALDPYDAHLIGRMSEEHGFRTSHTGDMPLLAHRLGRALRTLLLLRERGFSRGDVIELLRDGFRSGARYQIEELDEETRRARIAGGTAADLRAISGRSSAVETYITIVAELESVTDNLSAPLRGRDWSEYLPMLLSRFRLTTAADLEAAARVDDIAALFRRSAAWKRRFDVRSVLDAFEPITVPEGSPDAPLPTVWLGDVMRLRGRSFDHLFALRMQEETFPQRRVEDALLPDSDRSILRVREIGNGREEEQLLFQLLLDASTGTTHFSYATSDALGKLLRPSRLLRVTTGRQAAGEPAGWLPAVLGVVRTAGSLPAGTPASSRRALQLLVRSGRRTVFDGYVGAAALRPRFEAALKATSPTHLEDFGECPQKYFLKHILGVRDYEHPERDVEIDHREKGIINHSILEAFYRRLTEEELKAAERDLPRLTEPLLSRLEEIVDREFDRIASEVPPFNPTIRAMERRATHRVLREFVAADLLDLIEQGLMPSHFELRFGRPNRKHHTDHPEPFTIDAHGVTLRVDGTIDRIDTSGRRMRVIDYKSGKALRHQKLADKIDHGVRLQLALYALAASQIFDRSPGEIGAAIKPLVLGEIKARDFAFELAEKESVVRETLDIFARSILEGRFPAFPNEKDTDFNSCKYCPAKLSCRTKHDAAERRAVVRLENPRTLLQELL